MNVPDSCFYTRISNTVLLCLDNRCSSQKKAND